MFQRQTQTEALVCPDCGGRLATERDLLICQEHGAFFVYGPQLLVRAPRAAAKSNEPAMPWDSGRKRTA